MKRLKIRDKIDIETKLNLNREYSPTLQCNGQHYLLSKTQSAEMRNLLKIEGIPFYMLIDKSGVIKEKGNHLRAFIAKDKINEMLK